MPVIVIVCDNAPVHVTLDTVFREDKFSGARLSGLAPYSVPLNLMEESWSVVILEIKKLLNGSLRSLFNITPPVETSQTELRMLHLENLIDVSNE